MIKDTPVFPANIWDGTSTARPSTDIDRSPGKEDYDQLVSEIRAIQQHLRGLKDADGVLYFAPAVTKGTDPNVTYLNDKLKITTKDLIVAIGGSAVASVDLGYDVPVGSIILGAAFNVESTVTLATATKIGLGVAGTLNKYGIVTGGVKNTKSTVAITPTALATAEDIKIYATDNSAAAAGTIANGTIRVRLSFLTQLALDDAA